MNLRILLLLLTLWSPLWAQGKANAFLRGEYAIPNLGAVKNEILDYFNGGTYKEEILFVNARAKDYLEQRLTRPLPGKPAVVFDIDETCLSNFSHIQEMDFAFQLQAWNNWVNKGIAPPLEGTLDLYRFCRSRGLAIIFISGRNQMQRVQTENNLRQAGYEEWAELVLKDVSGNESALNFKTTARRNLVQNGYTILLNLGDQDSDLLGGYCDAVFKLPNPLYWVP